MRTFRRMFVFVLCFLLILSTSLMAQATGSWGQINQELSRPEGWQDFVEESPFQLGDAVEIEVLNGQPLLEQGFGTYPSLDGSTVAVPMAMEFARQHLGLPDEDLASFVNFSTTHGAYLHLIGQQANGSAYIGSMLTAMDPAHPVDLILATEPSEEELALAGEAGIHLVKQAICYDAFVFITHVDNPVDNLSLEQIRKIYGGTLINWKDVGGTDAAIYPYQREPNSGSQTAMENLVMQGRPLSGAEPTYITDGMSDLVARVGSYENRSNSLGYTYLYYIDVLYKDDSIKVLSVDGVAPTPENLRNGSYPFTTNYYAVYRQGEEDAVAGRFAQWLLSEAGQRSIAQAGYIPLLEVD